MPPRAVEDVPDAPAVAPPDLITLLTSGATFGGVSVVSIQMRLADGRVQRIELPDSPGEAELSELARRMLDALRKVGDWVNGAALSLILDPTGNLEQHGGGFKRAVRQLRAAGLVASSNAKGYRVTASGAR